MTTTRRADLLALAILTALIALLFSDVLINASALASRDLLRYAYPTRKMLHETVAGGEFPYWNRTIAGGQPLAANPGFETFYPLTWLILLPGFDYGFQLSIVLHVWIAGVGMYLLLRSLDLASPASFFGSLSFALGGLVLSCVTLLPILAAVAWLPLVLLFGRRYLRQKQWRDLTLSAFFLALQILIGEPTTILQTVALLGIYAVARHRLQGVARVALIVILGLALGAVQAVPAADHAVDSVRARGFSYDVVTQWSMPFARVGELLYPNVLGHSILNGRRLYWGRSLYPGRNLPFFFSIYTGVLVAVLAVAGFFARVRGRGIVAATFAASLLLALGSHTPLWRALFDAGLARSIRYPEKFILMGGFALIVLAAVVLDRLLQGDARVRAASVRCAVALAILSAVAAAVSLSPWHAAIFHALWHPPPAVFLEMLAASRSAWILAAGRAAILVVLLRAVARARPPVWISMAAVFVVLDLLLQFPELTPRVPADFLRTEPAILQKLPRNRGEFRFFHLAALQRTDRRAAALFQPSPDLPWIERNAALPMIPAAHGVQTALDSDFDLTALRPTAEFTESMWELMKRREDWLEIAASMSNVWYCSVLNDPRASWAAAKGDLRQLQTMDVLPVFPQPRYSFAATVEGISDRHDFVRRLSAGAIDRRTAYVYGLSPFRPAPGRVLRASETANTATIDVVTEGRAFLVMSVTPHKYWNVAVDGVPAEPVVTNVGYQGVIVPAAGPHRLTMRYRNPLIPIGAAISIASLLALAILSTVAARIPTK